MEISGLANHRADVFLLTQWQEWVDPGREENKFHCDLLLSPGAEVIIRDSSGHEVHICDAGRWAKVHLAASWEFREGAFVP